MVKNNITKFVLDRLEAFKTHEPMYGSNEAVEMCAMQLLEMELLCKYPGMLENNVRVVIETYVNEVKKFYPKSGNQPFLFIQQVDNKYFHNELYNICLEVRKRLGTDT